ncbi:PcfJ domain-containing protein [Pseudomonas aeruginosa]|nr:PcfJ domain-containing protein [Pseudomonas aeruginosa]MBH4483155.1 PcfJ domain-containing protein [Pseudomonas aeruginosa]
MLLRELAAVRGGPRVEAARALASAACEEPAVRRRAREAFGRADLAKVYRQAKDLIITHKLFRLVRYAELEGVRQLTISNLWRIERFADGAIRILEHDLVHDAWVEVEDLAGWPEVPFFPVRETRTLDWWREIARKAIWKALNAAGYAELPQHRRLVTRWVEVKGSPFPVPAPGQQEMSAAHMAYRMIERYIGKQVKVKGKTGVYRWKDGLLESKSMQAGARALRAGFFEHILDGEVLSAMRVIDYRNCSFTRYLSYARWREGLLKVAREHRNLLPLLRRINPEQWARNNLFSRKLWVRGGRRFTALDRRPIGVAWGSGIEGADYWRVCSFDDGAAWRWLSRASSLVVKEWRGGRAIVTHLALAKVSVRVPVCAYVHVLRAAERHQESIERYAGSYPGQLQQLLRVYLIHCATLWKEQGHGYVRGWLRSEAGNVSNMLDYLMNEGFDRGQPERNATWPALLRRSEDWHKRIAIEHLEREKGLQWSSLLGETVIDGIVFTPLNNSRALAEEGYEMGHCVGSYDGHCAKGAYQVYAVQEPDGRRSTLGFRVIEGHTRWDQHEGGRHGRVSTAALRAGKQLVRAYAEALAERSEASQAAQAVAEI